MTERIERTQDLYLIDMTGEPSPLPAEEGQVRFVNNDILAFVNGVVVSLITGSGITEAQHKDLDTLVHWIDENSYEEIVRVNDFITQINTWNSPSKTLLIRRETVTRGGQLKRLQQVVAQQFDRTTGLLKETMTEVYTRAPGGKIASIARTRVP